MHMVGIMALYSSSPPATWGSQCAMSSKSSSAAIEIESNSRGPQGHHHQSSKSVQGGLSSLFYSNSRRFSHHASHSVNDVLDASPNNSCTVGSLRSSGQSESAQCLMGWESQDSRSGAVNIPSSSLKSRERSPASVLQGPISRSGGYGSPMHSVGPWESPSCGGLPPLDPHVERISSRRRSSFSGERERWTVSRSVGFEVGNTATFPGEQRVRLSGGRPHETERMVCSSSEPIRVEGFGSGASAYGSSPLDTLTLPLYTTGKSGNNGQREAPSVLEAREKILRLAEEANGIFSGATENSEVDTQVGTSADELLRGAQSRYKVFHAPVVVKAFRMAEEAHKGQVRLYSLYSLFFRFTCVVCCCACGLVSRPCLLLMLTCGTFQVHVERTSLHRTVNMKRRCMLNSFDEMAIHSCHIVWRRR